MAEQLQEQGATDVVFGVFAALVEREGGSVPVTLNVGGMLVSGHLVSAREYFEGMAEEFRRALAGTDPKGAADLEEVFKGIAAGVTIRKDAALLEVFKALEFVHLRDAKFWHPGQAPIPTEGGVWWRGRLDAVVGFIFGTVGGTPEGSRA